jgi:hypothetical protein
VQLEALQLQLQALQGLFSDAMVAELEGVATAQPEATAAEPGAGAAHILDLGSMALAERSLSTGLDGRGAAPASMDATIAVPAASAAVAPLTEQQELQRSQCTSPCTGADCQRQASPVEAPVPPARCPVEERPSPPSHKRGSSYQHAWLTPAPWPAAGIPRTGRASPSEQCPPWEEPEEGPDGMQGPCTAACAAVLAAAGAAALNEEATALVRCHGRSSPMHAICGPELCTSQDIGTCSSALGDGPREAGLLTSASHPAQLVTPRPSSWEAGLEQRVTSPMASMTPRLPCLNVSGNPREDAELHGSEDPARQRGTSCEPAAGQLEALGRALAVERQRSQRLQKQVSNRKGATVKTP